MGLLSPLQVSADVQPWQKATSLNNFLLKGMYCGHS
jgi:hypothetical protein